VTRCVHCVVIQ